MSAFRKVVNITMGWHIVIALILEQYSHFFDFRKSIENIIENIP